MPTPSRTSLEEIVREGRRILEADGLEHLTMQRVARAVGVRAPSLYKHVRDRGDLIRLIGDDAVGELGERLRAASRSGDPRIDLAAMAGAHRAFAHGSPEAYRLLWSHLPEGWRVDPATSARAIEPVLRAVADVAGEARTLEAARTFTAWAHGFVSMELAGAFRLGGDIDAAFAFGIERVTDAMSIGSASSSRAGTRSDPSRIDRPSLTQADRRSGSTREGP